MGELGYLPAVDVAHVYGWSVGYTRKLASKQQWRRVYVGREVHYLLTDVDATRREDA